MFQMTTRQKRVNLGVWVMRQLPASSASTLNIKPFFFFLFWNLKFSVWLLSNIQTSDEIEIERDRKKYKMEEERYLVTVDCMKI